VADGVVGAPALSLLQAAISAASGIEPAPSS